MREAIKAILQEGSHWYYPCLKLPEYLRPHSKDGEFEYLTVCSLLTEQSQNDYISTQPLLSVSGWGIGW